MGQPNASNPADIAELVTKHINNLDDKGKLQLPDNMPDWQKHVIRGEKRTRDAQAALSKSNSSIRALTAKNDVLTQQALTVTPNDFNLTDAEAADLEIVKFRDPDAYRLQVNELERKAKETQSQQLDESTTAAVTKANETHIAKDRITVLGEFRLANPTIQITDDVLVNDVPPRFMNDLNAGKYDYHTYLTKVAEYIATGKVIPGQGEGDEFNLSNMSGSHTPGQAAAANQGNKDYKKLTF